MFNNNGFNLTMGVFRQNDWWAMISCRGPMNNAYDIIAVGLIGTPVAGWLGT